MKKNLLISMLVAVFALGSFLVAMPSNALAASVSGYVYDGSAKKVNTPIPGALVVFRHPEEGSETVAWTSSNGFYRIPGYLSGRTYNVYILKRGYTYWGTVDVMGGTIPQTVNFTMYRESI